MKNENVTIEVSERDEERVAEVERSEVESHAPSHSSAARTANKKRWLIIAAASLAVAAVALALILTRKTSSRVGRPVPAPSFDAAGASPAMTGTKAQPGEMVVRLSPEELESAQIKTEVALSQTGSVAPMAGGLRTTGVVQANQYKEIPVMPISSGIVKEVNVQLGDKVRRGQPLALLFSTELSETQGEYLRMQAEVEEQHLRHKRMVELVEIGAASREELEQATAAYKRAQAAVAPVRQKLAQLGMSAKDIESLKTPNAVSSTISVNAPSAGTIISRTVNPGEVIEMSKELFKIADLSSVWVIGQVYESDFAQVRVGSPATITTQAYPGRTFSGRVTYIDPAIEPQSRTAQARIEVANPGEALKFGMFVDVSFGASAQVMPSGGTIVSVPRAAIQNIGARQVVYVATDEAGEFVQRDVTTGPEANGLVSVYSGVTAGERVVTEGSFLLRAESLKLNPQQLSAPQQPTAAAPPVVAREEQSEKTPGANQVEPKAQTVRVVLTKDGFQPATIKLKRGVTARIIFIRQVEVTCATEVVISEFNIKRELPMNESVVVEFTPEKAGEFSFNCPMNMVKGKIIVQ